MDKQTIDLYNLDAERIAQLHSSLTPSRIYALITKYFTKAAQTLDVGCGIGRDTQWLTQQGYSALGVDASEGMLKQAQHLYPQVRFINDSLPNLNSLNGQTFQNILCSAVLMHLNKTSIDSACLRLLALLKPSGHLIMSIRGTDADDQREQGKLYEAIDIKAFKHFFLQQHCTIVFYEQEVESARHLIWHNFVITPST
ncbi:MAG: class I SAM-dependent methyltransferase [Methylococcaceae bacterium]